jgi:simple sugar transport system permease protein
LVPLTMLAGFAAGAFWGFIPGVLKARFGVNEILSTVMLNVVAAQILLAMLKGPLMDTTGVTAGTFLPQSEELPLAVWLPKVPQTLLHSGALVAILLAFVVYIFLWRTTIGYRIRAVGLRICQTITWSIL